MADHHPIPAPARINIQEPEAVRYWTDVLQVTEEALNEAVDRAGANLDAVRAYIGERPRPQSSP